MPANIKEIERRIKSVKNTQQITRAMKMVAAAKLRRTQDKLMASRPYGAKLNELLRGLAGASIDHPFLEARDVKRRLVVVVTSDKGLCGGYNSTIVRDTHAYLQANSDGVENVLYLIGRKGRDFFSRRDWPIHTTVDDLGGGIDLARINAVADEAMHQFTTDQVQEVVVIYTRFVSTLRYEPDQFVLLPLSGGDGDDDAEGSGSIRDYIYTPSAEGVLHMLLPKSVRNKVFNAVAEAFTSEHGARMTSMDSATNNAGDMIDTLTLFKNRARQAAITQEISEIVGGADAIA